MRDSPIGAGCYPGILALTLVGLFILITAPATLALTAFVTIGIAIGSLSPLSLIVSRDHLDGAAAAVSLMGFVQGSGYIVASVMRLIAGAIRHSLSSLDAAWILMIAALLIHLIMILTLPPADRLDQSDWQLTKRA